MITLRAQSDSHAPKIAVVGCLHGNEVLGMDVLVAISKIAPSFKNLTVIIANIPAYHQATRYIDQDLNRSFPGSKGGNTEERLASTILAEIGEADLVIDIHTTTSPGFRAAAITGNLNDNLRDVIRTFGINHTASMSEQLLAKSLIGQFNHAISLEYGVDYLANTPQANHIVDALLELQQGKTRKGGALNEYKVKGTIPKNIVTKTPLSNFVYSEELEGYPFIVDEQHYTDTRGFLLSRS